MYLALGTDPGEDSCFSIYQNNGIKMHNLFSKKQHNVNLFQFLARALPVILISASKSTNNFGYRELRKPIRARENGYRLPL